MTNILISIQNFLLSEAISSMLSKDGSFKPYELMHDKMGETAEECELIRPDILLMEVTYASEATLEKRLETARRVRERVPECKIVLLCDDNSSPDIAVHVKDAKSKGLVDAFFFASVSSSYMKAVLESL